MIGAGGGGAVALIIILPLAFFLFIYLIYFVVMVVFDDGFRTKILTEPTVSALVFVLGVGAFTWYFYADYQNKIFWAEVDEKIRKEREARNITLTKPATIKGQTFPVGTYIDNYHKFDFETEYDFDFAIFATPYDYHGYSISYIEDLWRGGKKATIKFAKPTQLMQFTCQADSEVELDLEEQQIEFADCIFAESTTFRGVTWEKGSKVEVSSSTYWDNRESDIVADKHVFYTYLIYRIHGVGTVTKNGTSYHEKLSYIFHDNYSSFRKEEITNADDVTIYEETFTPLKSKKDSKGNYNFQLKSNYMNSRYKLTHIKTGKIYTGVTDDKGFTAKVETDGEQSFNFDIYSD